MSGFKQDAIIFDPTQLTSSDNIITVPLTRANKKELVLKKLNEVIKYIKWHILISSINKSWQNQFLWYNKNNQYHIIS